MPTVTLSNWRFINISCDDAGLRPLLLKNIHIDPENGHYFDNYRIHGKVIANSADIPMIISGDGSAAIHFTAEGQHNK